MRNLDRLAAQTAQTIVKDTLSFEKNQVDNLATKTLGVLQENGVYAAILFLFSRSGPDEEIAPYVRTPLLKLAADEIVHQSEPANKAEEALDFVTKHISGDLDRLLLVKQVWEQTLIYTRYGAKARGGD
jgi:hypothetical protein